MAKVVAIMSMSLDGYVADLNDGVAEVFDWYFSSGDVEFDTGGSDPMTFKVSTPSAAHLRGLWSELGAVLTGRRTFEVAEGWGGNHAWGPAFVLTHHIPAGWPRPDSTVHFVTDGIESREPGQGAAARGTAPAKATLMTKRIAFTGIVVALMAPLVAHGQNARNTAYLELGGSAVVPSVNYERRLTDAWYGRVGLSVVVGETETDSDTTWVVPLTASWVSRPASNHHLELGGGITVAAGDRQDLYDFDDDEEDFSTILATGIIGYRYQKPAGHFQFRAAFTPVVGSGVAAPWAGVSFGYAW